MYEHLVRSGHSQIREIAPNDDSCGWVNTLPVRSNVVQLASDIRVDWVVIGAGFAGLAAARRLAELYPETSIAIIDAQRIGEGSAGRNSGFAVGTSPARGGDDETIRKKARSNYLINMVGLDYLRQTVRHHEIDCNWDDNGMLQCAADTRNNAKLEKFAVILDDLNVPFEWLEGRSLNARLGIDYYQKGIWMKRAALVQPAALARGLAQTLPGNVVLFEDSPVREIDYGQTIKITCAKGSVEADKVVVATNGLLGEFGLFRSRLMHLTLTASLTHPLSSAEREAIGDPDPWGVLSAHRMGATVRYTADRRIMMRNTAEYWPQLAMTEEHLQRRRALHLSAIKARWPMLPELGIEHTWSGVVAVSMNFSSVFDQPASNVLAVGGFNASGISRGTGLAKLLIDQYAGIASPALTAAQGLATPPVMPPRPFLDIGAKLKILRMKAGVGRE